MKHLAKGMITFTFTDFLILHSLSAEVIRPADSVHFFNH